MIRKPDYSDIDHIMKLSIEFNDNYYHRPLNLEKTETLIKHIIDDGVAFVSENGYIGGLLVPDWVRDDINLLELGWFATDRSGISLLNAFIKEGKRLMVDEIRMCTMSTSPESASRLLERKGFKLIETSYMLTP